MEYTRSVSGEGWRMLCVSIFVGVILVFGTLVFDMGLLERLIFTLIVLLSVSIGVVYSIVNIRSEGFFFCKLSEDCFEQYTPLNACGDSFHIKLSEITQIEIHDSGGEGSSDDWYIHTKCDRLRVTANYGNPHRKFGEAIQELLPHIETVYT